MRTAVIVVALGCSAAYAGTIAWGTFPGHWLVKVISVASLAWLARPCPLVAVGLLFGALGDALLSVGRGYFVGGLAAFLCGHVAYTAGFLRLGSRRGILPALAAGLYCAAFYAWLWPGLGSLRLPVLVYMLAIASMVAASCGIGGRVTAGAVLFLLSDSVLAANRFHGPVPGAAAIVWPTYYAGQWLIAAGCTVYTLHHPPARSVE